MDIDGIEDSEEREAPGNTVNDDTLALREELIDNCAEEEQMNERPDGESPRCRSEVGLLAAAVRPLGTSDAVNIGSQEQQVDNDVYDLDIVYFVFRMMQ